MNTNTFITPDEILSVVAISVADTEYKAIPKGFYHSLIQKAFEELAIDTFFQELRADLDIPENLIIGLPDGCFNVKNVYVFTGDQCNIETSHKIYWKRNFYPRGNGFIANDKGNNRNDPFYDSHNSNLYNTDKSLIRYEGVVASNSLYYNIQNGNLMVSSSCRSVGNKIHLHYNGTGCKIGEAPIIPIFLRTAIEDYVIEAALRLRMANEPSMARHWQALHSTYNQRLNTPYDGSWEKAKNRVSSMNRSQRDELKEYLSRGAWAKGF